MSSGLYFWLELLPKLFLVACWLVICIKFWLWLIRQQDASWIRRSKHMIPVQQVPFWWWLFFDVKVENPPDGGGPTLFVFVLFMTGCGLIFL